MMKSQANLNILLIRLKIGREVDKQRVRKHFADFGLARRYATKAAEHLGTVLLQIRSLQQAGLDSVHQ